MNMNRTTVEKTDVLKLLILLFGHFIVSSQLICHRARYHDWHPQLRNITFRLSFREISCKNVTQCWSGISAEEHCTNQSYAFPQLCPLEIQFGDALFVDLEQHGVNLMNVSKEEFESCLTEQTKKEHLSTRGMNGSMQVDLKWLPPGVHYFAATHKGSSHLCQLGLRFSVLVKEQRCQRSPHHLPCSGKGVCRAKTGQLVYSCQCHKPYSNPYCEGLDMCSEGPCLNGATCVSNHAASSRQAAYQCLCLSGFTGEDIILSCFLF